MEDLWRVHRSGVDVNDFVDMAEYKRFLKRFEIEEEIGHRRRLLFGEEPIDKGGCDDD